VNLLCSFASQTQIKTDKRHDRTKIKRDCVVMYCSSRTYCTYMKNLSGIWKDEAVYSVWGALNETIDPKNADRT